MAGSSHSCFPLLSPSPQCINFKILEDGIFQEQLEKLLLNRVSKVLDDRNCPKLYLSTKLHLMKGMQKLTN